MKENVMKCFHVDIQTGEKDFVNCSCLDNDGLRKGSKCQLISISHPVFYIRPLGGTNLRYFPHMQVTLWTACSCSSVVYIWNKLWLNKTYLWCTKISHSSQESIQPCQTVHHLIPDVPWMMLSNISHVTGRIRVQCICSIVSVICPDEKVPRQKVCFCY